MLTICCFGLYRYSWIRWRPLYSSHRITSQVSPLQHILKLLMRLVYRVISHAFYMRSVLATISTQSLHILSRDSN